MTGPEHYRKAGELLTDAEQVELPAGESFAHLLVTAAIAHAQLAHVAVCALRGYDADGALPAPDFEAWDQVAGVPEPPDEDELVVAGGLD